MKALLEVGPRDQPAVGEQGRERGVFHLDKYRDDNQHDLSPFPLSIPNRGLRKSHQQFYHHGGNVRVVTFLLKLETLVTFFI